MYITLRRLARSEFWAAFFALRRSNIGVDFKYGLPGPGSVLTVVPRVHKSDLDYPEFLDAVREAGFEIIETRLAERVAAAA